tara:strand:- start:211 stop:453 length:243 start_codon:yes stop_codon:yes gene_type:complete
LISTSIFGLIHLYVGLFNHLFFGYFGLVELVVTKSMVAVMMGRMLGLILIIFKSLIASYMIKTLMRILQRYYLKHKKSPG